MALDLLLHLLYDLHFLHRVGVGIGVGIGLATGTGRAKGKTEGTGRSSTAMKCNGLVKIGTK